MSSYPATLLAADRAAWLPHELITPAQWAERYRILGPGRNAEPGPYRLARTPYLAEILVALGDDRYSEVVVMAPAQSGKSECARNWLGWVCDLQPGPILVVLPNEAVAKEIVEERIQPMFHETPRLARLRTGRSWDVKRSRIILSTCTIYVGWAGSKNALSSRPIAYILMDEVDKYPRYSGTEADPMSLARARIRTWGHRGKVFIISTPTIPSGPVARSFAACVDRRTLHVPCSKCGELSEFQWERVQWEGRDAVDEAELLEQRAKLDAGLLSVYYECPECEAHLREAQRWDMVTAGVWVSEGHEPYEHPESTSIGFKIPGLASPWTSFAILAAEYVAAKLKGIAEVHHFYNSVLGLPFWGVGDERSELVEILPPTIWRKSKAGHERNVAPDWARVILIGADPGKRDVPYVIRAWGSAFRSRLLDCGVAESLEEVGKLLSREWSLPGGRILRPRLMAIDTGGGQGRVAASRTDEIYRFAKRDPARIRPLKGRGGKGESIQPIVTGTHSYKPPGRKATRYDITRSVIDTQYFKDVLAGRINHEDDELWEVYGDIHGDYVMQLCAERKQLVERVVKSDGESYDVMRWCTRVVGAPNHFLDCEVYCSVVAFMLHLDRVEATEVGGYEGSGAGSAGGGYAKKDDSGGYAPKKTGGGWQVGR